MADIDKGCWFTISSAGNAKRDRPRQNDTVGQLSCIFSKQLTGSEAASLRVDSQNILNAGAVAIGQRELQWVDLECGRITFPSGFVDTKAGLKDRAVKAQEDADERNKRPKGRYPPPCRPDWDLVGSGKKICPISWEARFTGDQIAPGGRC